LRARERGEIAKVCERERYGNQKDNVGDRERKSKRETERERERQRGVREIKKDTGRDKSEN
jgi:hypothetical protein